MFWAEIKETSILCECLPILDSLRKTFLTFCFTFMTLLFVSRVRLRVVLIRFNNSLLLVKLSPTLGDGEFVWTTHARR